MTPIDAIVQQWLGSLSHSTGRAGIDRPALESETMNRSSTEFTLNPPPTNDHGEDWTDAVRECGKHNANTPEQIQQALDRAQALISKGHSIASAVGIVSSQMRQRARRYLEETT